MNSFPLICDSGTGYMKMGYSNFTYPQLQYPAIVGHRILRAGELVGDHELKVCL